MIKLSKIDLQSNVNQKQACDADTGLGVRSIVVEGSAKSSVSDTKLLASQKECKSFLGITCHHKVEKIPVKSKFAENASCIDPKLMATYSDRSVKRFSVVLEILVQSKRILAKHADESNIQFQRFLSHDLKESKEKFIFIRKKEWLDVFLFEFTGKMFEYGQM